MTVVESFASGVVVVTGAAGGMGSHCARQMAEAGWPDLLLCDRDELKLDAVASSLATTGARVAIWPGDICSQTYLNGLVAVLGDKDIAALIHTAGVSPAHTSDIDVIFAVNLDASLRVMAAARPRMARGAAAVFFASIAGHLSVSPKADAAFEREIPWEGSVGLRYLAADANDAYLLGKRAIIATVKRQAKSWFRERHARLVSVSPGMVDTAMTQGVDNPLTQKLFEGAAISRYGRAEEVAAVCVFLCSPGASFITGTDVLIDGGELAGIERR